MAFEQKPNSGAMFVNDQKKGENHPDWRGDVYLDKTFLIEQMDKSSGSLVKIALSAWSKQAKSGKDYLSLSASEPWVKKDEDIPY
jgi:uncharacterized protein (DUF736 family)